MALKENTIDLKTMLEDKTVLLLGAGASVDYGFPLWDGLEKEFLFLTDPDEGKSGFSNHPGANYWRKAFSENSTKTVDELAFSAPDKGVELFQMMILHVFLNHEASDLRLAKKGWVEKFTTEYLRLLETNLYTNKHLKMLLENLSIISLNYERNFGLRFVRKVENFLEKHIPILLYGREHCRELTSHICQFSNRMVRLATYQPKIINLLSKVNLDTTVNRLTLNRNMVVNSRLTREEIANLEPLCR